MFGFTGSTLATSLNPFVGGFDWWGFILLGLAIVVVAAALAVVVGLVASWFASDTLLTQGRPAFLEFIWVGDNWGIAHYRALNRFSRGVVVGLVVFVTALAFGGSLLVHTERVEHADAVAVAQSDAADQVAQLENERDAANEATGTAVGQQYEQWLGLLGYDRVEDIDTDAQTATVVLPFCRRVVSMAGEFPSFILEDDGAGNVTTVEVQHRLILTENAAADPDHPFRDCFGESDLARIPGYVAA